MKTTMTLAMVMFGVLMGGAALVPAAAQPVDVQPAPPPDRRCTLSAGGQVIDYGHLSRWQLQQASNSQNLTFGKRELMLSVFCPFSQTMTFRLLGDRAANGELAYGHHGSLGFRVLEAQVDGRAVQLTLVTPGGITQGVAAWDVKLLAGQSFTASQNGQLVQGKSFNARIEVEPTLPEVSARVSGRQSAESNLTIELMD